MRVVVYTTLHGNSRYQSFLPCVEFKGSVSDKLYRPFAQKMHFFEILTTLQATGMQETQHILYQKKDNFIENSNI